jgi:putative DNA primase/helicase
MRAHKLSTENVQLDGAIHECSVTNKERNNKGKGWYFFHPDGIPNGQCFNYTLDDEPGKYVYKPGKGAAFSQEERDELEQRAQYAKKALEKDRADRYKRGCEKARARWRKGKRLDDGSSTDHEYLEEKGVGAYGLKLHVNALMVPVRNPETRDIMSLQTIAPNGTKKFLHEGMVAGGYHKIGSTSKDCELVCIAEGYSTGATIFETTGYPVFVAFNAGKLPKIAQMVRERYPNAKIVI